MSLSSIASAGRGIVRKGGGGFIRKPRSTVFGHPPRGHVHRDHHKIGPRGVPPISICVQGELRSFYIF